MKRHFGRSATVALMSCIFLFSFPSPGMAGEQQTIENLEKGFQQFLPIYIEKINQRDNDYLAEIHPDLPKEMYGFFFDLTLDMMKHAEANGLQPTVACKEYGVCKVTWPQPNDSWAAQTFILHKGRWRWLGE